MHAKTLIIIKIFQANLNPTDVSWLLFGSTICSINSRLVVDNDVSNNYHATFPRFAPFFRPRKISENYKLCELYFYLSNLNEL